MEFLRTRDAALIRSIATDPKIWPTLGDDLANDRNHWQPVMHEGIWYVLAEEHEVLRGLFIFFPENGVSWQIHICMFPKFWGSAARAAREVFVWLWEQTGCLRITASVPVWNAPALHCALRSGMKPYGVNEHSSLKHGRLHHQVLLGISRPGKEAA